MKRPLIYSFTLEELQEKFVSAGFKRFNAMQVMDWIYKKLEFDPMLWSNISKDLKTYILNEFDVTLPQVIWHGLSKDGTRKFLVKMRDGKAVETVAIAAKDRLTICISSQVGCAIGCTFCHTGTMGLTRNLEAGEIIGQYLSTLKWLKTKVDVSLKYTNIVYMGQGEPLHNFEEAKKSAILFTSESALALGQRRITLSTSGLVPQIEKLSEFPPINIAISLHAAHNDIRTELMPINKAFDLERLFRAIKKIPIKAHRYITFEYILIKNLNDRVEDIEGLKKLLDPKISKINIIPFNEYPDSDFKRPSDKTIKWFTDQLNNHGYRTTVRTTKGTDILAACGQLKSELDNGNLNLW